MCLLHFQLIASCLWSLSYYTFFRNIYGIQAAYCSWFPPFTTEVDSWFDTPSRQCQTSVCRGGNAAQFFCLLQLLSWALSTFFGVKCGELSTWGEMKYILDRYKLMLILTSYRWWWCQVSIWCSHAVFTHKLRISFSRGSVYTKLSGEEQRTVAATVTEGRAPLRHFAHLGWIEIHIQNDKVALSPVANPAEMWCYFVALLCILKPQWLENVLIWFLLR